MLLSKADLTSIKKEKEKNYTLQNAINISKYWDRVTELISQYQNA